MAQTQVRRQLTLFLRDQAEIIEKVRKAYNPIQHDLIAAHVTLCREDEIVDIDKVLANIRSIRLANALKITFGAAERFDKTGLWLPATADHAPFHELRSLVLKGIVDTPRPHRPHLTLIHPRNATCTDEIFAQISGIEFPTQLFFRDISLIEQKNNERWTRIDTFAISDSI